jgi:flagellar biosynthetic protein FliO
MSPYASYLIETFVTLVAVCALAFVVLYGARRFGLGRASGSIELVGQLPLDARRAVYLVKVGEQVFVVGVAEGGMTKLGELAASDVPTPAITKSPAFAEVLARALGSRKKSSSEDPS